MNALSAYMITHLNLNPALKKVPLTMPKSHDATDGYAIQKARQMAQYRLLPHISHPSADTEIGSSRILHRKIYT